MQTYIMRQMGDAWNPDRFCPYTGRPIFPHPYFSPVGPNNGPAAWWVQYWRDDGEAVRCRPAAPQEVAHIGANMAETVRLENAFRAWFAGVRKKY
jgi:hypothetical protein